MTTAGSTPRSACGASTRASTTCAASARKTRATTRTSPTRSTPTGSRAAPTSGSPPPTRSRSTAAPRISRCSARSTTCSTPIRRSRPAAAASADRTTRPTPCSSTPSAPASRRGCGSRTEAGPATHDAGTRPPSSNPPPRANAAVAGWTGSLRSGAGPAARLESDAVAALEAEHRPRLGRGGDLAAERLEHLAHLGDLLGVRPRELALADEQAVLEPDPHVAAEQRRLGAELELVAPGGEGREQVVVAEQTVGDRHHVREVAHVG